MSRQVICWGVLCLMFMGTAHGQNAESPGQDITRISSLSALLKVAVGGDEAAKNAAVSAMTNQVVAHAKKVAERSHVEERLATHSEPFQKAVENSLRARLDQVLSLESPAERAREASRLLREVTSPITTEHVVGQWLGFFESDVLPPEGVFAALQESAGMEGAFHFPLGAAALEGLAPQLSQQLRSNSPDTDEILLVADASTLVADVGAAGSHNGVVDPGEWALLRLRLVNESPQASFSASASVSSRSACAWVDEKDEDPLAEFTGNGGLVDVEFWVYISQECSEKEPVNLDLRIRESRGATLRTIDLSLFPMPSRSVDLTGLLIDRDNVGYSRSSVDGALTENDRVEISAGLTASDGMAQDAWLEYSFAGDTLALFSHIEHLEGVLSPREPGVFQPNDDLDLELEASPGIAAALYGAGVSSRWITMEGGVIWLAIDAAVDIPLTPVSEKDTDELEGEVEEGFVMVPPPDVEDIIGIVWSSIRLQARPVSEEQSGTTQAVNGVEVVLDEERLTQLYTDLIVAEDLDVEQEPVDPAPTPIRYQYRYYVPLQLAIAGSVKDYYGEMARAEEMEAKIAEMDEEIDVDEGLQVRVDIGAGLSFLKYQDFDQPYFFQEEEQAMAQIRGRLSVGTELMGIAAFDFGFAAPTLDGGSDGGLVDYAGSLGLGYRVRLETDLEAEPYLLARISYREVTGHEQTLSRLGLGFEAGIALRYFLESKTGVYLDAGYIVDAPGPRPAAPFNETPMIAHEVFKIVGGLTLGF